MNLLALPLDFSTLGAEHIQDVAWMSRETFSEIELRVATLRRYGIDDWGVVHGFPWPFGVDGAIQVEDKNGEFCIDAAIRYLNGVESRFFRSGVVIDTSLTNFGTRIDEEIRKRVDHESGIQVVWS